MTDLGFWDVVSNLGAGGAGSVVTLCVIMYFQRKTNLNGNGNGRHCKAEYVQSVMQSSMDAHTQLLEDIRKDGRDVRDGIKELVTIQRQRSH